MENFTFLFPLKASAEVFWSKQATGSMSKPSRLLLQPPCKSFIKIPKIWKIDHFYRFTSRNRIISLSRDFNFWMNYDQDVSFPQRSNTHVPTEVVAFPDEGLFQFILLRVSSIELFNSCWLLWFCYRSFAALALIVVRSTEKGQLVWTYICTFVVTCMRNRQRVWLIYGNVRTLHDTCTWSHHQKWRALCLQEGIDQK